MNKIFFTSDTHFGHRNIIRFCNRPFTSTREMDEALIANWNSKVGAFDDVFHLGDFAYGKNTTREYIKSVIRRLNGNIYLIRGNHEKLADGMPECFKWIKDYREIEIQGQRIILFHYGLRTWHHDLRGVWHLYGHSHDKLPPLGKSFDVGVDSWNYSPLSFEEVKAEMDKREINKGAPTFLCNECNMFPCRCDDNDGVIETTEDAAIC